MDQVPQSQPQNQQTDQTRKRSVSLSFIIISNTILVILIFIAEFYFLGAALSGVSLGGLAVLTIFFWAVIIGIPLIFISIILLIIAGIKLNNNPKVSENIAKIYIVLSLIFIVFTLPFALFLLPLSPLLFYNWAFITVFLKSKKHTEHTQFIGAAKRQTVKINTTYKEGKSIIYKFIPYFKISLIIYNLILLILVFKNFTNESVFSVVSFFVFSLPVQIAMIILVIRSKNSRSSDAILTPKTKNEPNNDRFPTFDVQPKSQNTPPDNKNRG